MLMHWATESSEIAIAFALIFDVCSQSLTRSFTSATRSSPWSTSYQTTSTTPYEGVLFTNLCSSLAHICPELTMSHCDCLHMTLYCSYCNRTIPHSLHAKSAKALAPRLSRCAICTQGFAPSGGAYALCCNMPNIL